MTLDVRSSLFVLLLVSLGPGCDGPPPKVDPRASLVGHTSEVSSVAFSPDGKSLASRGGDAVKLWDAASGTEVADFPSDGSNVGTLAFSPDGSTLARTLFDKGVIAWDLTTKQVKSVYHHPARPEGWSCYSVSQAWGLAYAPDGKTLAGGGTNKGEGGFVTLWDTASGSGSDIELTGGPVTSVAFARDGQTLAAKNFGEAIVLCDVASKSIRRSIKVGQSFVAPLAFSPDGKTLASADDNRRVRLWDAATGDNVASLKWHLKAVLSLAYHPAGRLLASGDSGGTILLWDLNTRGAVAHLEGHQGKVWSLAFSPDGKTLASAGEDKVVRLWDVPSP